MSIAFRKVLVCLIAIFAFGAVAASAASANDPGEQQEFAKEFTKHNFTSTSGPGTLTVAGIAVTCKKDKDTGTVVAGGKESFEKVVVTFEECEAKTETETCKIKSSGQPEGTVKTESLRGEFVEVATTEATTGVGLLLEPARTATEEKEEKESGKAKNPAFVTLEGKCIVTTKVTGSVVGEVTPLKTVNKKLKLEFIVSGGKQKIKSVERSNAKHCGPLCTEDQLLKPKLTAFGLEATESTSDETTFEEENEVLAGT